MAQAEKILYRFQGAFIYWNQNLNSNLSDSKTCLISEVNKYENDNHRSCKCLPNFLYNCCLIVSVFYTILFITLFHFEIVFLYMYYFHRKFLWQNIITMMKRFI